MEPVSETFLADIRSYHFQNEFLGGTKLLCYILFVEMIANLDIFLDILNSLVLREASLRCILSIEKASKKDHGTQETGREGGGNGGNKERKVRRV